MSFSSAGEESGTVTGALSRRAGVALPSLTTERADRRSLAERAAGDWTDSAASAFPVDT